MTNRIWLTLMVALLSSPLWAKDYVLVKVLSPDTNHPIEGKVRFNKLTGNFVLEFPSQNFDNPYQSSTSNETVGIPEEYENIFARDLEITDGRISYPENFAGEAGTSFIEPPRNIEIHLSTSGDNQTPLVGNKKKLPRITHITGQIVITESEEIMNKRAQEIIDNFRAGVRNPERAREIIDNSSRTPGGPPTLRSERVDLKTLLTNETYERNFCQKALSKIGKRIFSH